MRSHLTGLTGDRDDNTSYLRIVGARFGHARSGARNNGRRRPEDAVGPATEDARMDDNFTAVAGWSRPANMRLTGNHKRILTKERRRLAAP